MVLNDVIITAPSGVSKKLISTAEKFLKNDETVLFSIVAQAKLVDSIPPKGIDWKGAKDSILVVTSKRIIIGQKQLLSSHFQELLPQLISSCYKRNLSGNSALCISTKQGSMAIQMQQPNLDNALNNLNSIKDVISDYSSEVRGFPERDKNNKRLLKVYDTIVTGVDKNYDGHDTQMLIRQLGIGERVTLVPDPKNRYDELAIKVCNTDGIQIGWIPKGEELDSFNFQRDLFGRLMSDSTVLASVKEKYENKNGKIGIVIDVARYAIK